MAIHHSSVYNRLHLTNTDTLYFKREAAAVSCGMTRAIVTQC